MLTIIRIRFASVLLKTKTAHRCKPMRCAIVLSYLCLVVLRTKLTHSFGSAPHLRFAESGEFFLQTIAVVRL